MLIDALRPKNIRDVVGLKAQLGALAKLYAAGDPPQMILLAGEPGSGKTTLARILGLAAKLKVDPFTTDLSKEPNTVKQINAAAENGIDNVRALIEGAQFGEIDGSASVVILNEVQALTKQAQKGLLDFCEFPPEGFRMIMTTMELGAIDKALVERFHVIYTKPLVSADLELLVARGLKFLGSKLDPKKVSGSLLNAGIQFPRMVLTNVERLHLGEEITDVDPEKTEAFGAVQDLCSGRGPDRIFAYLKTATAAEAKGLRMLLLSYLNTMNLGGNGRAADSILKITGPYPFEEAAFKPWLGASCRMVARIFAAK